MFEYYSVFAPSFHAMIILINVQNTFQNDVVLPVSNPNSISL